MSLEQEKNSRWVYETDICVKESVPRWGLTFALFVTGVGGLTVEEVTEESNVLLFADNQVKV